MYTPPLCQQRQNPNSHPFPAPSNPPRRVPLPCSKEAPPQEKQYNEPQRTKWPILLQQQLPVDPDRRPPVLLTVIPQPRADLAHALEAVPTIQQILDILGHDLCDIAQLIVQLVEVLRGPRVAVRRLGLRDEVVELHEGVGPQRGAEQLRLRVRGGELGREVREVGEGELARVGALRDAAVHDVRGDQVVDGLRAALDGGLRLGVAVEPAQDQLDLGLDFGERGLGGFVVDGGAEVEACWGRREGVLDFGFLGGKEGRGEGHTVEPCYLR